MSEGSRKLKTTLVILAVSSLLLAMPAANVYASKQNSHNFAELVWGNGVLWSMIAPPSPIPHPGAPQGQEDFYEEAPQVPSSGFPASPQQDACDHLGLDPALTHTPCLHDHTLGSVPGQPGFRALWHVYLVLCGPIGVTPGVLGKTSYTASAGNSCNAESVTGHLLGVPGEPVVTLNIASSVWIGGTLTPLTSASAVESAASAGTVTIFDTGTTFICPVQLYSG